MAGKRMRPEHKFGGSWTDAKLDVIGRHFIQRLKTAFVGVADPPGVLRNSVGSLLYLLCFAINNQQGRDIGLRIASHLLSELK